MYYAGIGSRKTPVTIQRDMYDIAIELETLGIVLRSGGAMGADQAFERGVTLDTLKTIYYADHYVKNGIRYRYDDNHWSKAREYVRYTHSNWNVLTEYAKSLHTRNYYQIIGLPNEEPSSFVICYTADGCETGDSRSIITGGTGTAITIANANEIPVFNLFNNQSYKNLRMFLDNLMENSHYGRSP